MNFLTSDVNDLFHKAALCFRIGVRNLLVVYRQFLQCFCGKIDAAFVRPQFDELFLV